MKSNENALTQLVPSPTVVSPELSLSLPGLTSTLTARASCRWPRLALHRLCLKISLMPPLSLSLSSLPLSRFLPFFPFFPYLTLYLPHILSPANPKVTFKWFYLPPPPLLPFHRLILLLSSPPLSSTHNGLWCWPITPSPRPPPPAFSYGFWDSYLRKPFLFHLSLFWVNDLNAFSLVPGLLCYLLKMGVAWVSKSLGKVQFRSHFLWRSFFESLIWQNGKNSWPGNKTTRVK